MAVPHGSQLNGRRVLDATEEDSKESSGSSSSNTSSSMADMPNGSADVKEFDAYESSDTAEYQVSSGRNYSIWTLLTIISFIANSLAG